MSSSPTPREVRRLASDHDFVLDARPAPRRLGWWAFVATHLSLPAALCAGLIFVIVAVSYTSTTSKKLLNCPPWALSCDKADEWTIDHLGTIQGIITLIYSIGMAALAFVALALCEVAIWPLLSKQLFTIRGLEAYLSTTRGSVMAVPTALMSIKTPATGLVISCAVTVILLPLAAAPLVGYAFTPTQQSVRLESNYTPGGGISALYAQKDPPTSVIVDVLAVYNPWAKDPSSEPMPTYRDWYIDRQTLCERGTFSAKAVRLQTSISCSPHKLQQLNKNGLWWNAFKTNLTRANSSGEIWVRPFPQLTVWADNFTFLSTHRTKTTLVFAALNGTIDGGAWTLFTLGNMTGASAVACEVDIEAVDDILAVGDVPLSDNTNLPVLSSTGNLQTSTSTPNQTGNNEMLLWFTVAPLMAGTGVDGAQPMFYNSTDTNLPLPYTTQIAERNSWTVEGLETFIRMSIGALAQATSSSSTATAQTARNQTITSTILTKKLSPSRALLLLILPFLVIGITTSMACWNVWTHHKGRIPVMRMAGVGEMLKSAQTKWMRDHAATDAAKTFLPNELGGLEVKYGVDKNGIAGLARSTRGFNGNRRVEFEIVSV
ncbi:hypothetical protein B0H63DRAFT_394092 [Podospora didyma]|uniref:Transmembrane protein n=1 Tax=Podospora didyma TaxID=330526 RepID=A0AAE0NPY8_9PEZI|nr:hypothetical protein B0H63DRAFT_394092 [Podospora didyma]